MSKNEIPFKFNKSPEFYYPFRYVKRHQNGPT